MKKLILIPLLAWMALAVQAQNLVVNGDMEDWKNQKGLPKSFQAPKPYIVNNLVVSNDAHSGNFALRMIEPGIKSADNKRFDALLSTPLTPGKYRVGMWLKGKGNIRFVSLTKIPENPSSTPRETNFVDKTIGRVDSDVWVEKSVVITVPEGVNDPYRLHISFNSTVDDDRPFLIDDLSVEAVK